MATFFAPSTKTKYEKQKIDPEAINIVLLFFFNITFLNACRLGHKSVLSSKYRFKTKDECFHLTFLSGEEWNIHPFWVSCLWTGTQKLLSLLDVCLYILHTSIKIEGMRNSITNTPSTWEPWIQKVRIKSHPEKKRWSKEAPDLLKLIS